MRKMNEWIALALMATLGGCFFAYEYEPTAGTGGTGGAGGGGIGASNANSSSGSNGGNSSSGGVCTVTVCGGIQNSTCSPGGPCATVDWARRFGTGASAQEANTAALYQNGDVVIGGMFDTEPVDFDGLSTSEGTGIQGFLVHLGKADGKAVAAATFAGMAVVSIATDNNDSTVAIGAVPGVNKGGTLHTWNGSVGIGAKPTWTRAFYESTPTSVAMDNSGGIYVLAEAGTGAAVDCIDPMTQVNASFFVVRYDVMGTCSWVKPFTTSGQYHAAAITARNGIWVTGYFANSLEVPGGMKLVGNARRSLFLMRLDVSDGTTNKLLGYYNEAAMGDIIPAAIDTLDIDNVFVAGTVAGPTEFDTTFDPNAEGAFVLRMGIVASGDPHKDVKVFRGEFPSKNQGARATGIQIVDKKLYVAGTYSGTIAVDPTKQPYPSPAGNTPFVALLDTNSLQPYSFEAFPGGGEPYSNEQVHLAGSVVQNSNKLVLAGGWTKSLDFAHGMMQDSRYLGQPVGAMQLNDIFVARFNAP